MEGKSSRCLICYATVKGGKKSFQDRASEEDALLTSNLKVIFIVKTLFEVPRENLENYLENCGDPDAWVEICSGCFGEIDKAWDIYKELLGTISQFAEIRSGLVDLVKTSVKNGKGGLHGDSGGGGLVTAEVRRIVNIRNYSNLTVTSPTTCPKPRKSVPAVAVVVPKEELPPQLDEEDGLELDQFFDDLSDQNYEDEDEENDIRFQDNEKDDPDYEEETNYSGRVSPGGTNTEDNGDFRCNICKRSCKDNRGLLNHLRYKHKVNRSGQRLQKEEDSNPAEGDADQGSKSEDRIANSMYDSDFTCKLCGRLCKDNRGILNHLRFKHKHIIEKPGKRAKKTEDNDKSNPELKCKICGRMCKDYRGLVMHLRIKHNQVVKRPEKYVCPVEGCGKEFVWNQSWNSHIRRHKTKPSRAELFCKICKRGFYKEKNYNFHMKCHQRRNTVPNLSKGLEMTNATSEQDEPDDTEAGTENASEGGDSLECKFCGKPCMNEKGLILHLARKHKNGMEIPDKYCCEEEGCGQEFKWKSSWVSHMKRHRAAPKFKCDICGREIYDAQSFRQHMEAHERGTIPTTLDGKKLPGRKRMIGPPGFTVSKPVNDEAGIKEEGYPDFTGGDNGEDFRTVLEDELILLPPPKDKYEHESGQEGKVFKCKYCEVLVETKRSLQHHMTRNHNDVMKRENLVCSVEGCSVEFPPTHHRQLRVHQLTHRRKFRCRICSKEFFVKANFLYHKQAHRRRTIGTSIGQKTKKAQWSDAGIGKFICDLCGKELLTEKSLKAHLRSATAHISLKDLDKFKCKHCGKGFHMKRSLEVHELTHDKPKPKPVQCELCGDIFVTKYLLKNHTRKTHEPPPTSPTEPKKEEKIICNVCGKIFYRRDYLRKHILYVHEKRFRIYCDLCGKGIISNQHLRLHKRISHKIFEDGVQEYRCTVNGCMRRFFDKDRYETHVKEMHSGQEDKPLPFVCQYCGAGFWHHHRLRDHVKRHEKSKYSRKRLTTVSHEDIPQE